METSKIDSSIMIQDALPDKGKNVWTHSLCGYCVAYYDYDNVWKNSNTNLPLTGFSIPTEWKPLPRVIIK